MLIVGDSNTKDIVFGPGKGKVGESFPGKRTKAANISQIKPEDCIGYTNIIIACGTNDLRTENVRHETEIHAIVDKLRYKLLQVTKICPKARITVMPVLPSRNHEMNRNIMFFNHFVDLMLAKCFRDVWYPSVHEFLDKKNLLAENLTRNGDAIHLNERGIARYVSKLKYVVFQRECESRRVSKRMKSNSKSQRPVPAPS